MSSLLTNLAECINMTSVNHIFLTPTVARLLNPKDVPNLTHIVLGGEPMSAELVASFAPRLNLFNAYGPTGM
jgi:non-ribosomal peptide synthetase component F